MLLIRCLLFILLLLGAGCRREAPPLAIDPSLARLVPADTVTLAGVRMVEVRGTPVYLKLLERGGTAEFDRFARASGIDPRRDVEQLLAASDGKNVIVLSKGKFAAPEVEKKLEQQGARKVSYRGRTIVSAGEAAVVILDRDTAAAGSELALKAFLDQAERSQGGIPQSLRDKLGSVPPHSQVWAVTLGANPLIDRFVPDTGVLSNLRRLLESVESGAGGIDLRSGVNLDATAACRTEQDAKLIHDALRGFIGMGRLSAPDNAPELLRFYDAIEVRQQKAGVRLRADLPMELIEKLLEGGRLPARSFGSRPESQPPRPR